LSVFIISLANYLVTRRQADRLLLLSLLIYLLVLFIIIRM